uniref:Retrotransposon Copia-like N-terminal domain-containing protein n=1 Tax=Manihot esculenta TaxID=3983 RepID=A0A2C9V9E9_MANES
MTQGPSLLHNTKDNPHSPYYLLYSDSHASVVITPQLTFVNYSAWSRSFLLALFIRNKAGFIDGSIPCPATTDPLYSAWVRCNNLLMAWLLKQITSRMVLSPIVLYISNSARGVEWASTWSFS